MVVTFAMLVSTLLASDVTSPVLRLLWTEKFEKNSYGPENTSTECFEGHNEITYFYKANGPGGTCY